MDSPSKRASEAMATLDWHGRGKGGNYSVEPKTIRLIDLVTDLMHLAAREGVNFTYVIEMARDNFHEEGAK